MIRIFSTKNCPYCITLKKFLKKHNIVFEDIDITKDERFQEEIFKKTGRFEAPVVEIDNEIIIGFDKEKIVKLLNIKS